jgi:hypothetical protein
MTRQDKQEEYDTLRNIALSNQDVRELITQKEATLDKMVQSQQSVFYTPQPTFRPKGDLNLPKEHKLSDQLRSSQRERINQTRQDYDSHLKEKVLEYCKEKEFYDIEKVEALSEKETGILLEENGVEKLLDYQKDQEKAQAKETSKDNTQEKLPTYLDHKAYQNIWGENKQDITKAENIIDKVQDKEKTQDKLDLNVEHKRMDLDTFDNFMADNNQKITVEKQEKLKTKFKEQSKDIGKSSKPDPADRFE